MAQKPKRIMRRFRMDELASVDRPAQEGARATLLKRASGPPRSQKYSDDVPAVMTSSVEGHAHLVYLRGRAGATTWQTSEGADSGHSHPWMLMPDGAIEIGESEGHSHEVDQQLVVTALLAMKSAPISTEGLSMPTQKTEAEKAAEKLAADLDKVSKRAERAESVLALPAEQRAHFDKLAAEAQDAFLAKSEPKRDAEVAAAKKAGEEADPVVFKSAAGIEFRKSDDPRLVAMAKQADASEERAKVAEKAASSATFLKRAAEELPFLPGTVEVRAAMLKAVDGIADEAERTAATEALKAQNAAMAEAFKVRGAQDGRVGGGAPGSADDELDKLAKAYAAENKVDEAVAYSKVLDTPAGAALYRKSIEGGVN